MSLFWKVLYGNFKFFLTRFFCMGGIFSARYVFYYYYCFYTIKKKNTTIYDMGEGAGKGRERGRGLGEWVRRYKGVLTVSAGSIALSAGSIALSAGIGR